MTNCRKYIKKKTNKSHEVAQFKQKKVDQSSKLTNGQKEGNQSSINWSPSNQFASIRKGKVILPMKRSFTFLKNLILILENRNNQYLISRIKSVRMLSLLFKDITRSFSLYKLKYSKPLCEILIIVKAL